MSWKDLENPLFIFERGDQFAKFHLDFTAKHPPRELFHYTADEALIPILNSQLLYATERTCLNDGQEFTWGFNSFRNLLKEKASNAFSHDFIDNVLTAIDGKVDDDLRHFIVSLSAKPDLLSQWRAYAANGKGFAIGLNCQTLRDRSGFGEFVLRDIDLQRMPKQHCFCYQLLPVIYDKEAQQQSIVEFLNAANAFWNSLEDSNDQTMQKFFRMVVQHRVKELLISFKNPAFSEECEWRLVATVHKNSEKIHYRNGRFGITPYLKLNVSPRSILPAAKLDISSLWVGPNSPARTNRRGLDMLLASKGIQADLSFSDNEYRG
jgi:hypothetical protein